MNLAKLSLTAFSLLAAYCTTDAAGFRSTTKNRGSSEISSSEVATSSYTYDSLKAENKAAPFLQGDLELDVQFNQRSLASTNSDICPSVNSFTPNRNADCTCSNKPELKRIYLEQFYYCANDVSQVCKNDLYCGTNARCKGGKCARSKSDGARCGSDTECSQDSFCDAVSKVCTSKDFCPVLPTNGRYFCHQDVGCECEDSMMVQDSKNILSQNGQNTIQCYFCKEPTKADGESCSSQRECSENSYCDTGITNTCKSNDVCPGPPKSGVQFFCLTDSSCSCEGGTERVSSTNSAGDTCFHCQAPSSSSSSSSPGSNKQGGSSKEASCPQVAPRYTCVVDSSSCSCSDGVMSFKSSSPSSTDPSKSCYVCSKPDGAQCSDRFECGANSYCDIGSSFTCKPNDECIGGFPTSSFTCKDSSCKCPAGGVKDSLVSGGGNTCYYCE